ncbi:MAG: hypothetical protein QOD83_2116 [Solirubrobacteraceae bacterium]|nr:hypothetical protein [Solirubrobacteraceae bacterium]
MHTVLVDMPARLAGSDRPDRIFEVVLETAKKAGLVGRRRVLDSTALYDAVSTMDTVTLIRAAIRGLLRVCDHELQGELRGLLERDDDYRSAGKPVCDYDDAQAREALVDALAKDARALLGALDGRQLPGAVREACPAAGGGRGPRPRRGLRRRVPDRPEGRQGPHLSTVDPEARHGHKTAARGFDDYKGMSPLIPTGDFRSAAGLLPKQRISRMNH